MSTIDDIPNELYEQYVQSCLQHLYDYAFLQDHPLVHLLVAHETGAKQVHVFRELVTRTIEQMRLGETIAPNSRVDRSYNLLVLRYIDQQDTQHVIEQMELSERQFYREHPKALRTISTLLRNSNTTVANPESTPPSNPISVESEVQRLRDVAQSASVEAKEVIESAIAASRSLARQHNVDLDYLVHDGFSILDTNEILLRQTVLGVMSLLITRSSGAKLTIECLTEGNQFQVNFALAGTTIEVMGFQEALAQQDSLQYLVHALDSVVTCTANSSSATTISLALPIRQQIALVIDDNPDVAALFRRYLANEPYHVLSAADGKAGIALARKAIPGVIILDIMLPGQDGLDVLQNLKAHPLTRQTPVLVCSILETPDLVLSLGADGFLRKPPRPAELLNALAKLRA